METALRGFVMAGMVGAGHGEPTPGLPDPWTRATARSAAALAAKLALAGACACAWAGGAVAAPPDAAAGTGWEAVTSQGLTLAIRQSPALGRDGYVLTRRYPDGAPDPSFGSAGVSPFQLGPDNEGPAVLRLDSLGRPWVAGASVGADGRLQAVLLRWLSDGRPDPSFGRDGRAAQAPAGRQARATDLRPLPDGGAMVAGLVTDGGDERVGWWRVDAAGQVDTRFGLGGLWLDPAGPAGEPAGFAADADGTLRLRVRRGDGAAAVEQAWALAPRETTPRAWAPAGPAGSTPPPAVASAPASGAAPAPAAEGDPPIAVPPVVVVPAAGSAAATASGGRTAASGSAWTAAGVVAAAAVALVAWRRQVRRAPGRRGRGGGSDGAGG